MQVAPAFYPALYWGGPTTSVYELCNHIANQPGIELRVLTTDTSGPATSDRLAEQEKRPEQYPGYSVHFCRKFAGVDFTPSVWRHVWGHVEWADVIHLNAVYSSTTLPTLLAARVYSKPVVWSPRGALQRWAGSRSLWKKTLWEALCRLLLRNATSRLHATSKEEAEQSAGRLGGIAFFVVPNGVVGPATLPAREWIPSGTLRVLFLGRLDPKKGIENLLQVFTSGALSGATLEICGEGEAAYEKSLQELAAGKAKFLGHVDGGQKSAAFFRADVCVVPSFTENFALVVAESLAHGTPVIASTGAPWQELEARGAGWWVANTPESLTATLEKARNADLAEMGRRGRQWMIEEFSWDSVARRMLEQYRTLAK